jgi:hypothetical protein
MSAQRDNSLQNNCHCVLSMMLKKMDFKARMRFIHDPDDLSFHLLKFPFCGSHSCSRIIVAWKKTDE